MLHLETKGIRQSIARAFLRGDGESAQSQINHSDDDHTHTHTLTPPPLPMRIDPRANHSGSRVPLSGSILLPPAQSGSLSARQCSPSQVVCAICIALACYLTLIRLLLTYLLTSYGDNKIKIFWGTYPTGYNQHNTPNKSYGFFANFMNESTKFQVPRSLALTPPPPSSHD